MLIAFSTATRRNRMRRSERIGFAPNSLLRSNNSLLAQNNSLLVRVGNLSRSYWICGCFRDGFSRREAESAKFPAFFPATRELCTSDDRELIGGKPPRTADRQGLGTLGKTRIMLGTASIQDAATIRASRPRPSPHGASPIRRSRVIGNSRTRTPVACHTALATAPAVPVTPISPTPLMPSALT